MNTNAAGDRRWLYSTGVPVEGRVRCVRSVASLFAKVFEPRCKPRLSHLSQAASNALNGICYMWWDAFPSLALAEWIVLRLNGSEIGPKSARDWPRS
ncbi:protein of unknown function [Bradyrhizobium vignae]|uniref:Uncharacterized protein n=1 Tax=Bradyrhizobium vignae TaxID=1549949 RepID=A0A2U3Q8C9_9BRAD|nr:protein of unknown function [Bradyrhizobium vignae]